MFDSPSASWRTSLPASILLAVFLGIAFSGLLSLATLYVLHLRGVDDALLRPTLIELAAPAWFETALRLWCVAAVAYRMCLVERPFPWAGTTLLGFGVGVWLMFEAWYVPAGTAARLPTLALWGMVPAAWAGTLLACPFPDAESAHALDAGRAESETGV